MSSSREISNIYKDCYPIYSLNRIFEENRNKRICVVATSCAGESTILHSFKEALDMDDELFPLLTKDESDYVCGYPWTEDIGKFMDNLAKSKLNIIPGHPLFGTVVLDADIIVFLHIDEKILKSRCLKRKVSLENSLNMQRKIEEDLRRYEDKVIILEMSDDTRV